METKVILTRPDTHPNHHMHSPIWKTSQNQTRQIEIINYIPSELILAPLNLNSLLPIWIGNTFSCGKTWGISSPLTVAGSLTIPGAPCPFPIKLAITADDVFWQWDVQNGDCSQAHVCDVDYTWRRVWHSRLAKSVSIIECFPQLKRRLERKGDRMWGFDVAFSILDHTGMIVSAQLSFFWRISPVCHVIQHCACSA